MNIEKDFRIVDGSLQVSDLMISNPVASESLDNLIEMKEVFFDESEGLHGTIVQRSVDSERNSLPFGIHYMTSELDPNRGTQQGIIRDITGTETDNVPLQHCQENTALLKVWNVAASEFLLIPCQLEGLKPSPIVEDYVIPSSTPSTRPDNPRIETFDCAICGHRSDTLSSSLIHYEQAHQSFKCPFCVKYFPRSHQLKGHLFVHSDRREFVCTVCKKQFKRRRDLQQHRKLQHSAPASPDETFLCDSCGFQSNSKNSIRLHVQRHLGVSQFVCDVCSKPCKNHADLTDHRNIHFDIKSYECDVCKTCFARKETMVKHRRTQHEGLYSFICDVCGRCFLHKTSFLVHLKMHAGENQVKCDVCGKMMSSRIALFNHKKMHTQQRDFVCGICGKMYINKHSLQEHLLVHTGSNPFQCLQCDNSFSSRKKLLMHERIHDPQRTLYKCSGCEKSYTSKFKLREHFRKFHL